MKKIFALLTAAALLLSGCSVGVISGEDGPAQVYVGGGDGGGARRERDEGLAEDAVQQSFLKIFQNLFITSIGTNLKKSNNFE